MTINSGCHYEMTFLDRELVLIRALLHKEIKETTAYVVQAHKTCAKIEGELKRRRKRYNQNSELTDITAEEMEKYTKEMDRLELLSATGSPVHVPAMYELKREGFE